MKTLLLLPAMFAAAAWAQPPAAAPDPGLKSVIQIAIACRDIEATSKQWAAALGVDPPKVKLTRPGREVNVVYRGRPSDGQIKMAVIRLGQVSLELMEPVGADTSWREFLESNGEGVQHIAFGVTDLEKTVKRFEGLGMPVVHRGRYDADNGTYIYLDSKRALGVTVELLHSDPKKQ
jgi:hypothetical protein